jgi:hypothetical protein
MARMRAVLLVTLMAAPLACATTSPRAPYALHRGTEVVLSNSPMLVEKTRPVLRAGRLEVPYAVLLLNRRPTPLTIHAATALVGFGE